MIRKSSDLHYIYRSSWLTLVRPLTLTGSIAPALAGGVLASHTGTFDVKLFLIFLAAALLVQMAVNIFNDYFDFMNGQDLDKWKRAIEEKDNGHPKFTQLPKVAAIMLTLAALLGIWLAVESTIWILPIGALSILAGIYYSAGKRSLSSHGMGELVAAFFLGFIVAILAYVTEAGQLNGMIIAIAVPYAALIAAMILVNNIRDMQKDKEFRCTLPIVLGRKNAIILLNCLLILPYCWMVILLLTGVLSWQAIITFAALPIALMLRYKLRTSGSRVEEMSAMKWAAYHHWTFGLLYVIAIWIGY